MYTHTRALQTTSELTHDDDDTQISIEKANHTGAPVLSGEDAVKLLEKQKSRKGYHYVDADCLKPYDNPIHYQYMNSTLVQSPFARHFFMAKCWMQAHIDALYYEHQRNPDSEYWIGVKYTGIVSTLQHGVENMQPTKQRNINNLLYFFHKEQGTDTVWMYIPCHDEMQARGFTWWKCQCVDIGYRLKKHPGAPLCPPPYLSGTGGYNRCIRTFKAWREKWLLFKGSDDDLWTYPDVVAKIRTEHRMVL